MQSFSSRCCFLFRFFLGGNRFSIKHWAEHSCTTEIGSQTTKPGADPAKAAKYQKFPPSAYSAVALAPLFKSIIHTKPSATSATAMLGEFLVAVPERGFVHSVLRQAKGKSKEISEEERVSHLDSYCQLLRAQGHHAKIIVTDFEGMEEASLNFAV